MNVEHKPNWHQRAEQTQLPTKAFIGGVYVDAISGETFDCVYPGNGKIIAEVAACGTADVDAAVISARRAFESGAWSRAAPAERKKVLLRFSELLLQNREELGLLETLNVGKPIANSTNGDIPSAANCIAWYAEAIDKVYGEVAVTADDVTTIVVREPVGVVAAVVPWNYPLSMAAWKLGPALATGNSVILKPAEQSPFTALRIAQLAMDAGLPAGVLNVVPGLGHVAGKALGLHMDVDCVGFTGSTEVGRYFMQYSGQSNIKRIGLELGGKSPQVVLADCDDLDAAARSVAAGIFANSGQVCNAGSRLIVEDKIKDRFLEKLLQQAAALSPADPLDPSTKLGSIVTEEQLARVMGYIEDGVAGGARIVAGGNRVRQDSGGFFVEPTIFDGVSNQMKIAREEIFGPVLATITVRDFDEAMTVANDTIYGLAAGVWTNDVKKAHRAAKAIKAGVVWVNCFDRGLMSVPFGGFKQSGFGRDKSIHAMEKYTDLKAMWFAH
ncbi:aldehyde dehydrogenase [Mesorhizobium sp. NZP2298]|uniref:aldehyde dehydrogenase n=1 Tax=Mesorhizobium sp. NZP2298 TaxID=2483403 RepID=UPI00155213D4|nr:aldehyde dehydrogenase [Mesorhizobium sp. NZP2298]QKC94830.1 aldehyde dehydrogenase [Mesorhizobium sp. NZP2298]